MKDYKALLVDDEPLLCRHLNSLLSDMWPELEVVGSAANGQEAFEKIVEVEPDLVFLDICMPQVDGMALAKKIVNSNLSPMLIFITAHNQYAVEAFEHEAIDYLLKPIQEQRLEKTLQRIKARLCEEKEKEKENAPVNLKLIEELMVKIQKEEGDSKKLTWIKTTRQGDIYLIDPKDVFYFQAEDKYTTVVTEDNEYHIRMSIKELAKKLDDQQFWQIHRSTLVNSKCIDKVNKEFSGRMYAYLKNIDKRLQVSRSFAGIFKQM